jgi:hypothetical protein
MHSHQVGSILRASRQVPGSGLGSGSLLRPTRLGALPAVPRHPVRALAVQPAVVRAGGVGGAARAVFKTLPHARRRRRHACGRHPARAAAHQAKHRQGGAAQLEMESKVCNCFIISQVQEMKPGAVRPGSTTGQPAPPCQGLRVVGVAVGATARDVERSGSRADPRGCLGAIV